jgi:hypothetical protein
VVRFLHGGGVLSKVWFWRIDSNEPTPTAASTFNYCWDTLNFNILLRKRQLATPCFHLWRAFSRKRVSSSDYAVTPLTEAILGMVDSAVVCLADSTSLKNSAGFRSSSEQAYEALSALDVSVPNTEAVMEILLRNANGLTGRYLRRPSYQ